MDLLDQINLEHVRVRGAPEDAALARLRASHLLATAGLRPPAMPPSAVLVVRSMADPLPGRIAAELSASSVVSAEWEQAAQNCLGELYARAARPAWGPVSNSVRSVLFADYGELLACLAIDVGSGSTDAWWWRSVFKRHGPRLPGSWANFWAEHPKYVPSALQHLDSRGNVAAVLERIAPVQAWRILAEVAKVFDLPASLVPRSGPGGLRRPADLAGRRDSSSSPAPMGRPDAERRLSESNVGGPPPWEPYVAPSASPPWEPYVPASATPTALGVERRALLGIGLLLCRAPAATLTSGFSSRFHEWLRVAGNPDHRRKNDNAAPPFTRAPSLRNAVVSPVVRPSLQGEIPPHTATPSPIPAQPPAESRRGPPVAADNEQFTPVQMEQERQALTGQPTDSRTGWETGADTRLGGILYLIHLVRQMDLVRHFDTNLSGWSLLELIARCLLDPDEQVASDPIWDALAKLDDRDPRIAPGRNFTPRTIYTAPDSWLHNLSDAPNLMRFRSRGFELWRPEGFLILDSAEPKISATGEFAAFTHRERRRFRRAAEVRPAGVPISKELRRFLHFILPYARWRLSRVLRGIGLKEVFLRHGKLVVSSSHVDLVMSMKQVSVPVRLAGLDANPGWAPELGRVVTFYFLVEAFGG